MGLHKPKSIDTAWTLSPAHNATDLVHISNNGNFNIVLYMTKGDETSMESGKMPLRSKHFYFMFNVDKPA